MRATRVAFVPTSNQRLINGLKRARLSARRGARDMPHIRRNPAGANGGASGNASSNHQASRNTAYIENNQDQAAAINAHRLRYMRRQGKRSEDGRHALAY